MRTDPDEAANSISITTYRMPSYRDVAAVRLQNCGEDTYRRGLASTIGPQKAKDLTLINGEGDAVDSLVLVKAFMKIFRY